MKFSGMGRELGSEGISAFTQAKHVHLDFAQVPSPEWWFSYERPAIPEPARSGGERSGARGLSQSAPTAAVEFVHLSGVGSRSRKARSWAD